MHKGMNFGSGKTWVSDLVRPARKSPRRSWRKLERSDTVEGAQVDIDVFVGQGWGGGLEDSPRRWCSVGGGTEGGQRLIKD